MLRHSFSLALPLALVLAACSGSTTSFTGNDDGGGDGGDGGGGGDSGGGDSGDGGAGACPANAPTDGQPCTTFDLDCEFGGIGDHRLCTTTAKCVANGTSGHWVVIAPGSDCVSSPGQNPPECPADFTTRPTGSTCPKSGGLSCVYAQGECGCIPCIGDGGGAGNQHEEWACDPYPAPSGCPEPRPLLGSPCTQEQQTCGYGETCGVVGGPFMVCQGGRWKPELVPAACAIRQCGK